MWKYYLLHLWVVPDPNLALLCPPPVAGQPGDPGGFYDFASVAAAFDKTAVLSVIVVVLVVIGCYQFTRVSLGARFIWRWWISLGLAALLSGAVGWVVLSTAPTRALAGSCETNPDAFLAPLPASLITERAIAGLVWGVFAFVLVSVVLTKSLGYFAHAKNGFFHNRGCPWPRLVP